MLTLNSENPRAPQSLDEVFSCILCFLPYSLDKLLHYILPKLPSLKCSLKLFNSTFVMHKDLWFVSGLCFFFFFVTCHWCVYSLAVVYIFYLVSYLDYKFSGHGLGLIFTSVRLVHITIQSWGVLIEKLYYNYL